MTTTTLVSVKTCFSSSTRSAFCERSMPTPKIRPDRFRDELQQKPEAKPRAANVRGAWIDGVAIATHDGARTGAPNDSCPRLGCRLSRSPESSGGSCLGRLRTAEAAAKRAPIADSPSVINRVRSATDAAGCRPVPERHASQPRLRFRLDPRLVAEPHANEVDRLVDRLAVGRRDVRRWHRLRAWRSSPRRGCPDADPADEARLGRQVDELLDLGPVRQDEIERQVAGDGRRRR